MTKYFSLSLVAIGFDKNPEKTTNPKAVWLIMRLLVCSILLQLSSAIYAADQWATTRPSLRPVTINGFTRARANMVLSTEVSGRVKNVTADIGEYISAKGHFACLDDTFVRLDIKSAKNKIAQHAVDIKFLKKQVARHQKLVEKNSAAVSLLDDLQRQLGNSRHELQGEVVRLERLKESRRRHCITAPTGWAVIERHIEPGQWVEKGFQVAIISDYSKLLIPVALSFKEMAALEKLKGNILVKLTDFGKQVPAVIDSISPAFDEQSRKIRIDLRIAENLPDYRGGLRVELTLLLNDEADTYLISKAALEERFEEFWMQRRDGKKIRVLLLGYDKSGLARIKSAEIKSGNQFRVQPL